MRVALIDGDISIYQAASVSQYPIEWDEDIWTLHGDMQAAKLYLDELIADICTELDVERLVMCLSDSTSNWRKEVMPSYKSNRSGVMKPILLKPLRAYVHERYETWERPGLEGDDVLGILATHPTILPGQKIIVSIDKDMQTIPGYLLNWTHARQSYIETGEPISGSVQLITEEQADRFFYIQSIAGDAVDGYSGVPGLGMKRAADLIDNGLILEPHDHVVTRGPRKGEAETKWKPGRPGTPWEIVVSAYRSAGLSEEVALQTARVARICRYQDFDFDNKRAIPWNPPRNP